MYMYKTLFPTGTVGYRAKLGTRVTSPYGGSKTERVDLQVVGVL